MTATNLLEDRAGLTSELDEDVVLPSLSEEPAINKVSLASRIKDFIAQFRDTFDLGAEEAKDNVASVEAELLVGADRPANDFDKDFIKDPQTKKDLHISLSNSIASAYLERELRRLEGLSRYNERLRTGGESGAIVSKEFWERRANLVANASAISNLEPNELNLKKLMLGLYDGFIDADIIVAHAEVLNYELFEVIKDAPEGTFDPLVDPIKQFLPIGQKEPIKFEDGLSTEELRAINEFVKGVEVLARKEVPEVVQNAKDLLSEIGREKAAKFFLLERLNDTTGDGLISAFIDFGGDTGKLLWNSLFGGEGEFVKAPIAKLHRRMTKVYGPDWPAALSMWMYTTFYLPTKGIILEAKAARALIPKAEKFYQFLKSNPGAAKKFLLNSIEGAAWLTTEGVIKAPFEYIKHEGTTDEFIQFQKQDLLFRAALGGSLGGFLGLTIGGLRTIWNKTVEKVTRKKREALGDLANLSSSELLTLGETIGHDATKAIRAAQLKEGTKGFQTIVENSERTGFDPMLQVGRGTAEPLVKTARESQIHSDLGLSTGNHLEYMASKVGDVTGSVEVITKDGAINYTPFNNKSEKILGKVLTNNQAELPGWLEFAWGGFGKLLTTSRRSEISKDIVEQFRAPLRRLTGVTRQRLTNRYKKIFNSVSDRKKFNEALAFSDQQGVNLSNADLVQDWGLGTKDQKAYAQLRVFFDDLWVGFNDMETTKLVKQGFKAIKGVDLGGGQQQVVREIKVNTRITSLEKGFKSLPNDVQKWITNEIKENGASAAKILEQLKQDSHVFVRTWDIGRNMQTGVRFVAKDTIVPLEQAVTYNPGYAGGVVYKDSPVHVVAINKDLYTKQLEGKELKGKAIAHIRAGRYWNDATQFIEKNKAKFDKRGIELIPLRLSKSADQLNTQLPSEMVQSIGRLNQTQAEGIGVRIGKELSLTEEQTSSLVESLLRASINPFNQRRGKPLTGLGRRLFPGNGRWIYKKDGTKSFKPGLRAVLNQPKAGLVHIEQWANTITNGPFRRTLREQFVKQYGDLLSSPGVAFSPLVRKVNASKQDVYRYWHGTAIQDLMRVIHHIPTEGELRVQNMLFNSAEWLALDGPQMGPIRSIGSKVMDEMGLQSFKYRKIKGIGSALIFNSSIGILFQQLVPAYESLIAHNKGSEWIRRYISNPMIQQPGVTKFPIRFAGNVVDAVNINPLEVPKILRDAHTLALSSLDRMVPGQPLHKIFTPRMKRLSQMLDDSFILGEMKNIEEYGNFRGAISNIMLSFFMVGEGAGRIFSFASANRSLETEFKWALSLAKSNKLTPEAREWLGWFQRDGNITSKGLIELTKRASDLFFNLTTEEAPKFAQGYTGILTQYSANIASHMGKKYIFGKGFTTGQKFRMLALTSATFGSGAIPFMDDALGVVALLNQLWDKASGGPITQRKKLVKEYKETLAGFLASRFDTEPEVVFDIMQKGMVHMDEDMQWNVTQRLFASAIYSDFVESRMQSVGKLAGAVRRGDFDLVESGIPNALAALTPATKAIYGNFVESPILTFEAIMQMMNRINPRGFLGTIKDGYDNGNISEVMAEELDNIKRQAAKNSPGVIRLLSFLDTYGINATGEEVWAWKGRVLNEDDPNSTRIKVASGLGPAFAGETFELSQLRRDTVSFYFNQGLDAAKLFISGNEDQGNKLYEKTLNDAIEGGDQNYIDDLANGYQLGLLRAFVPEEVLHLIEKAKTLGE